MQEAPKLTPEIRHFAKTILAAKTNPMYDITIEWFKAGAWYIDAIFMLVLILPEDDPTLTQILDSMRSGTFYENEVIAKNILRIGIAMYESTTFIIKNARAESLLLYTRALVQNSIKQPNAESLAVGSYSTIFKILDGLIAKANPLWWLACGAIGALILL